MTKKEYNDRLAELQAQLDELKNAQIEDAPPHPRWRPNRTEKYYSINNQSCIIQNMWVDTLWDEDAYSIGNVFATIEAANFAGERLKVIAEMREWAGDWNDTWALLYAGPNKVILSDIVTNGEFTRGEMRFATREDAKNCIRAVGADRIIKYYFCVRELHECCTNGGHHDTYQSR